MDNLVEATGKITTYVYDPVGKLVEIHKPDGSVVPFTGLEQRTPSPEPGDGSEKSGPSGTKPEGVSE
jgi:YD repeat-containing protein